MGFRLSPQAETQGYRLESFESVSSTNALALERAGQGDPGRLWLVSDHQMSGRGRRGRVWETPRGNLAATLLIVSRPGDGFGLQQSATLGFVAGLALAEALDAVVPNANVSVGVDGGSPRQGGRFELKWPNDVLAHGSKLSGILLESAMLGERGFALAIGIGVNVVAKPLNVAYPATSLADLGADCDAPTLFLALSDAWTDNFARWSSGRGTAVIRERWLQRAAGLGSQVAVRVDGEVVRGVFETIDEECRFVIRREDGRTISIAAGDVHFGAVASAGA